MQPSASNLRERRSHLFSLLITAVLLAIGVNLVSSWMSDSTNTVKSLVLWSGVVAIVLALVIVYVSLRPERYQIVFKTGVFLGPTPDGRITLIPFQHFKWANIDWLDSWDGHNKLAAVLPSVDRLQKDDREAVTRLLSHLLLMKLCERSEGWHATNAAPSRETDFCPGLPTNLSTPIALTKKARFIESDGVIQLKMSSWVASCEVNIRPLPDALTRVAVTPVFEFAQEHAGLAAGTNLYAAAGEVTFSLSVSLWWGFTVRRAELLSKWFTDIANELSDECNYQKSMSRLEQLVLFELFRKHSAYKSDDNIKLAVVPPR